MAKAKTKTKTKTKTKRPKRKATQIAMPKIETRSLASLKKAPYNPRTISDVAREHLRASMKRWGLADIPVINKRNGRIIGGHQRIDIMLEEGVVETPVLVLDLPASEEKALNVTLNSPVPAGVFTSDVSGLLKSIQTPLGAAFGDVGLDALLKQVGVSAHTRMLRTDDDVPDPPRNPVARTGDIWELGEHRLYCGDTVTILADLVAATSPTFLITDPPYGMELDTDWSGAVGSLRGGKSTRGNKYPPVIGDDQPYDPSPLFTHRWREAFMFGADYYAERIPDRTAGSWLVWDKRKESQAEAIGSEFELIWSAVRHKRRLLRHDWFGFLSSKNAAEARDRKHPTQKPTSLLLDILTQWSKPDDVVCDPYMGSGSTIIACERAGLPCMGVELSPAYVDVAVERWQNATGGKAKRSKRA